MCSDKEGFVSYLWVRVGVGQKHFCSEEVIKVFISPFPSFYEYLDTFLHLGKW